MWRGKLLKAGNIQNLTEARYFSSKAVDLMGFNFNAEKADSIAPIQAQQIIAWLEGPEIVGEFGNDKIEKIKEIATVLNLKKIQIPVARASEFADTDLELILHGKLGDFASGFKSSDILQIDCSEETMPFADNLQELLANNKVILKLDWQSNLLEEWSEKQVYGFNFNGSGELKTGAKSFAETDKLFELMEDEF